MKPILSVAFAICGMIATCTLSAHAAAPCEDMLKQMRETKASAKLSDADMQKVGDLETKAIERCNADDDTRADRLLAEAMKIMGK